MSIAEKLQTIAENEQRVYEAGKKSEYYRFWETLLGNIGSGFLAFAGRGWNDETFNPPRGTIIRPADARYMFANTGITDFATLSQEKDITFDFSKSTAVQYLYYQSVALIHLGILDFSGANSINSPFYGASNLHKELKGDRAVITYCGTTVCAIHKDNLVLV